MNYKFFILFLGYALLYCIYVALSSIKYFLDFWSANMAGTPHGKYVTRSKGGLLELSYNFDAFFSQVPRALSVLRLRHVFCEPCEPVRLSRLPRVPQHDDAGGVQAARLQARARQVRLPSGKDQQLSGERMSPLSGPYRVARGLFWERRISHCLGASKGADIGRLGKQGGESWARKIFV